MEDSEIDFSEILDDLVNLAKEDGKVTDEEENYIQKLGKDIEEYQETVNEAKLDDFISDDEFHDLVILRDKIITDALEFETDSADVNKLIDKLFDEINNHTLPGMEEDEIKEKE